MTIRYTCPECGVVMKIKDEKAGSNAKCPKCKTAFVVPSMEEAWDGELEFESPQDDDGTRGPADNGDEPLPPPEPRARKPRKSIDERIAALYENEAKIKEGQGENEAGDADGEDAVERIALPDDDDDDEVAAADSAADDGYDPDDEDPDMPLELTPAAPSAEPFDPSSRSGGRAGRRSSSASDEERRASVADLMKDFDSSRRKEKKTAETVAPAPVSTMATSGTAAEALSRAYQQKRENASNPRPKPVKENLERELFIAYLKKNVPYVLLALVLSYGLYKVVNRRVYTGPPLAPVYGQLTRVGEPLAGYQVRLVPVQSAAEQESTGRGNSPPGRSTASGITDEEGYFTMMYSIEDAGASIGDSTLEIMDASGIGIHVPPEYEQQTVPPEGIDSLRIDLP